MGREGGRSPDGGRSFLAAGVGGASLPPCFTTARVSSAPPEAAGVMEERLGRSNPEEGRRTLSPSTRLPSRELPRDIPTRCGAAPDAALATEAMLPPDPSQPESLPLSLLAAPETADRRRAADDKRAGGVDRPADGGRPS
mmetsp:Transcript_32103/g.97848  ORF Transcript_32103/g.97848 Transcript_32103/m.97848 type:complete len:140 (-) Transcript_32103:1121-1540(-)|eukprot:scaffold310993_cov32-Tisochrysis_lutea.AAC.3